MDASYIKGASYVPINTVLLNYHLPTTLINKAT